MDTGSLEVKLQVPPSKLREYQERYDYTVDKKLKGIRSSVRRQGYLTRAQLHKIADWKSERRSDLVLRNSVGLVREVTRFAFSAKYEAARIGALILLEGVKMPTASVVLHFCVSSKYPILDYRALWSLGIERPSYYSIPFWLWYVKACRSLAKEHRMSVRELDMALWQYSREHQGKEP